MTNNDDFRTYRTTYTVIELLQAFFELNWDNIENMRNIEGNKKCHKMGEFNER